jgi:hypothetical protein
MDTRTRTILLWSGGAILFIAGIVILILSFRTPKETVSTVDAVYTDAALTLSAQALTKQADLLSATPNTVLLSPTPTFTPLASSTVQQQVATSAATSVVPVATCDKSVYISDVTIPDGTVITPGQTFTKTWKVSNTGTCAWTATYQIIFISGDLMGGKATPIGKIVNPGESIDVSVSLTAPAAAAANLTGTWRLSNDKSQPFGTLLTVVIKSAATGTVSVTSTNTTSAGAATATATPTPTLTSVAYPNP